MENALVAGSNFVALFALSLWSSELIVFFAILVSLAASLLHHIVERNKHDMPGCIDVSARLQEHLFNAEQASFVMLGLVLLPHMLSKNLALFVALCALLAAAVSENVEQLRLSPTDERLVYILSHSMWHMLVFVAVGLCAYEDGENSFV